MLQKALSAPQGPPAGRRTKRFASLVNIKDAVTSSIMTKKVLLSPNLKPAAGGYGQLQVTSLVSLDLKKVGHVKYP